MQGAGTRCGEPTNILRDGNWMLAICAEPFGHDGEHYDPVFSYPWYTVTADEGGMACL